MFDDATELNRVLPPANRCAFPAAFLEALSAEKRSEAAADAAQTTQDIAENVQVLLSDDSVADANVRRNRRSSIRVQELAGLGGIAEAEEEEAAAAPPTPPPMAVAAAAVGKC
jgi:hypothetical protein